MTTNRYLQFFSHAKLYYHMSAYKIDLGCEKQKILNILNNFGYSGELLKTVENVYLKKYATLAETKKLTQRKLIRGI